MKTLGINYHLFFNLSTSTWNYVQYSFKIQKKVISIRYDVCSKRITELQTRRKARKIGIVSFVPVLLFLLNIINALFQ